MKIAILGWGSLIWKPKSLNYNTTFGWQKDGPILPLEFARISKDGRLTLVITKEGTLVTTLYSISNFNNLDDAILNLKMREGNKNTPIGYYTKNPLKLNSKNPEITESIREWLLKKEELDAVIWTDLDEKWTTQKGNKVKKAERIDYLKNLQEPSTTLAEEYIRKAPIQIATNYRKEIEKELGWYSIE